jgi:hypothetical protein
MLLTISPQTVGGADVNPQQPRHVVILLDVSPSMRLQDAGNDKQLVRMQRARELIESLRPRADSTVPTERNRFLRQSDPGRD